MAPASASGTLVNDINVAPMIDVLLVLLVVFMVLCQQRTTIRSPVSPPARGPMPPTSQLVLQLPDGGGYLLNGQPIPDLMLDAQIAAAMEGRVAKLLFVDAGGERTYQEVITAMDRARGAGAQVVALMPAAPVR